MVAEEKRKGISLINERMDKLEEFMHSCTPHMKPFEEDIDSYLMNTSEGIRLLLQILTTHGTHEPNTVTSTSTHPKKCKRNKCVQYTKDALAKKYSREEHAKGEYEASTKKYKGVEIISDALSPTRLKNIANVVNEKCRKTRLYKIQK